MKYTDVEHERINSIYIVLWILIDVQHTDSTWRKTRKKFIPANFLRSCSDQDLFLRSSSISTGYFDTSSRPDGTLKIYPIKILWSRCTLLMKFWRFAAVTCTSMWGYCNYNYCHYCLCKAFKCQRKALSSIKQTFFVPYFYTSLLARETRPKL